MCTQNTSVVAVNDTNTSVVDVNVHRDARAHEIVVC